MIKGDIVERDKKILELYSRQDEKNKMIENIAMRSLTSILRPFEYTIPKILKTNRYIY